VFNPALKNAKNHIVRYNDYKPHVNPTIYEVKGQFNMPNPDALWQDIQKLDDLYEELLWNPDDELQFNIEYLKGNGRVVITNKTQMENLK